jgi:2-polyprenyl-3-methyl-5-hydroxy-6-metoxy-1,4-benzoquinol methylase
MAHWLSSKGVHTVGMDNSASGVAIARKTYLKIDFVETDLSRSLGRKYCKRFDLVVSLDVIEHLLLPRQLFARAREALKAGGYLIISTPYHGYWKNLALALTASFDGHWHPLRDFGHIKFFSKKTLTSLSEEQGFEVVEFVKRGRIPALAKSMIVLLKERPSKP